MLYNKQAVSLLESYHRNYSKFMLYMCIPINLRLCVYEFVMWKNVFNRFKYSAHTVQPCTINSVSCKHYASFHVYASKIWNVKYRENFLEKFWFYIFHHVYLGWRNVILSYARIYWIPNFSDIFILFANFYVMYVCEKMYIFNHFSRL